eukprot:COSAG02_NODE_843_length_16599_cov_6.528485_7_plen_188_part_00
MCVPLLCCYGTQHLTQFTKLRLQRFAHARPRVGPRGAANLGTSSLVPGNASSGYFSPGVANGTDGVLGGVGGIGLACVVVLPVSLQPVAVQAVTARRAIMFCFAADVTRARRSTGASWPRSYLRTGTLLHLVLDLVLDLGYRTSTSVDYSTEAACYLSIDLILASAHTRTQVAAPELEHAVLQSGHC